MNFARFPLGRTELLLTRATHAWCVQPNWQLSAQVVTSVNWSLLATFITFLLMWQAQTAWLCWECDCCHANCSCNNSQTKEQLWIWSWGMLYTHPPLEWVLLHWARWCESEWENDEFYSQVIKAHTCTLISQAKDVSENTAYGWNGLPYSTLTHVTHIQQDC